MVAMDELFSGRHDEAIRRLRRAIELDPNSSFAHGVLSAAYAFGGEADLANQQAQATVRLSPRDFLNVIWHITGAWAHFSAERFEEAAKCARRAIDWNPAFADAHGVLAAASAYLGRMADARASLDGLPASSRGAWPTNWRLGHSAVRRTASDILRVCERPVCRGNKLDLNLPRYLADNPVAPAFVRYWSRSGQVRAWASTS
jgi:predicted Zn-dependent protease